MRPLKVLFSISLLAIMALSLTLVACNDYVEVEPEEMGLKKVSYEEMSINGTTLKGMVADNFADRVRAESAIALSEEDGQFACLVYGFMGKEGESKGVEAPLQLAHDFKRSGELVYINSKGVAVKVFAGDKAYLPPSLKNAATRYQSVPVFYDSVEPASIALYLQTGMVEKLGIAEGKNAGLPSEVLAKVATADSDGIKLYFIKPKVDSDGRERQEDPVSVITQVATSDVARARGVRAGAGPQLFLWPDNDETLTDDGFWLKGVEGDYSLAFLRLQASYQQSRPGEAKPMAGFVVDIIEGAADSGDNDLERARWYPSEERISRTLARTRFTASGLVNAVLVLPGKTAFADRGIDDDMPCMTTSLLIPTAQRAADKPAPLTNTVVKVGATALKPTLLRTANDADQVVLPPVGSLASDHVKLVVFNAKGSAMFVNPTGKASQVAALAHTSGNSYQVSELIEVKGRDSVTTMLPSRFALYGPHSFKKGDSVELPWQAIAMRPMLMPGAFFKGERSPKEYPTQSPEGGTKVHLEVADNDAAITKGLMYRESLRPNHGMLFIFETLETHQFWMKNCKMDIDVAFIDEDMEIVTIHEMKAEDPDTPDSELKLYPSKPEQGGHSGKVLYAVEMAGGWFAKAGFKPGDHFWLPIGHKREPGAEK